MRADADVFLSVFTTRLRQYFLQLCIASVNVAEDGEGGIHEYEKFLTAPLCGLDELIKKKRVAVQLPEDLDLFPILTVDGTSEARVESTLLSLG